MNKLLIRVIGLFALLGCTHSKTSNNMAFEDVRTISEFPITHTITREQMIPVLGSGEYVEDFAIYDSLLVIDTNQEKGLLEFRSTNTLEFLGELFDKGNAEGELAAGIDISLLSSFYNLSDSLYISTFDSRKGTFYRVNLTKALNDKKIEILPTAQSHDYPRPIFWAKALTDSLIYYRTITDMETRQCRFCINDSKEIENDKINRLNNVYIPADEDINILSTLMAMSPNRRMIVEAPLCFNYINVYSLFDNVAFTICDGEQMINVSDVINKPKFHRPYMYGDIRAYDFGFGVLKFDTTDFKYQNGMSDHPKLLFFDWNGNPIASIETTFNYSLFDYDLNNNVLYVLDNEGILLKTPISLQSNESSHECN